MRRHDQPLWQDSGNSELFKPGLAEKELNDPNSGEFGYKYASQRSLTRQRAAL